MNIKMIFTVILILLLSSIPFAAAAQQADLTQSLVDLGLSDPQVTLGDNQALVTYKQPVAGMGEYEAELEKIAQILALFEDQLSPQAEITVRQLFDDGQIMQIVSTPAQGKSFLAGEMTADDFVLALSFEPQTRGPVIVEGTCNIDAGDTCQSNQACTCYPNEECRPGDAAANSKGCVTLSEPANAHLEGSEYACNDGYVWNSDLTACEPELVCPEGMVESINRECVQQVTIVPETNLDQVPDFIETEPKSFQVPTWLWFVAGGGCIIFVGLIILLFVMLRRRKKHAPEPAPARQPAAQPAPTRQAAYPPPPPALPEPFAGLERRYNAILSSYQSGGMSQEMYQAEMKKLVVQDSEGRYWTLTPSGWLWYDGQRWIPAQPR